MTKSFLVPHAVLGKISVYALLLGGFALGGCQSNGNDALSLDAAKDIAADFQIRDFVPPERTIVSIRKLLGESRPVPMSCDATRAKRKAKLSDLIAESKSSQWQFIRRNQLRSYSVAVEVNMALGNFSKAEQLIAEGLNVSFGNAGSWEDHSYTINGVMRSAGKKETFKRTDEWELKVALHSQRSRLNSSLGNVQQAEVALGDLTDEIPFALDEKYRELADFYEDYAKAALANANGDLGQSEALYRSALDRNMVFIGFRSRASRRPVQAGIIRSLLLQNRLIEAEVEARSAIERIYNWDHKLDRHTASTAALVTLFARVILEQGRIEDAAYLAKLALNMFEVDCAELQSLGIIQVRKALMVIEGARKNWSAVLDHVAFLKSALSTQPEQFSALFGRDLNRAEAEIYAGDAILGFDMLSAALIEAENEYGADSYAAAEISGLLALGKKHHNENNAALALFAKSLTPLTGANISSSETGTRVGQSSRRNRILAGYMTLLQDTSSAGSIDVASELLRISSVSRLGKVQEAFAAVTARSSVKNPELASLVRQEQDVSEELRSTGEILAYILSAPKGQTDKANSKKALGKRLQDLRRARKALSGEILSRYPDYSELISPKPLDRAGIQRLLKPNQAMLVYHVLDNHTFVWAISKAGKLHFAKLGLGREALIDQVATLRKAVDPGPLGTLGDIPDFDTALAHKFFSQLLQPVKAGWDNAKELLIVTDGPLGALPFSMLVTNAKTRSADGSVLFERYRDVAWLAREVAITHMPSINTLKSIGAAPSRTDKNRRQFIGFGDPFFSHAQARSAANVQIASTRGMPFRSVPQTRSIDSADLALLPRLPDTRTELQSIAAALKADPERDLFLGVKANEATVKTMDLSVYNVISFATHGLVPGDLNGLDQPALALSAPRVAKVKGDGLLTMNEILALKLNADFAVLSACNTAAADGLGAEAVSGLGRAFLYAGARALLVSNWPVHSGATTNLMTALFSDLATNPGLTRSEALRRTRLKLIDDMTYNQDGKALFSYAHPIFWAPFTIVGDGGATKSGP